jgi:hypothetical protein
MGTDATDLCLRVGRLLSDDLQLGIGFDRSVRERGQPLPETAHEIGLDVAWRISQGARLQLGYNLQRVRNPLLLTGANPNFSESSVLGVTLANHLVWSNLAVEF